MNMFDYESINICKLTESTIKGAIEWAKIPHMWINETPWDLTGVGSNSAAYCIKTLAAMFNANLDDTDIANLPVSKAYVFIHHYNLIQLYKNNFWRIKLLKQSTIIQEDTGWTEDRSR